MCWASFHSAQPTGSTLSNGKVHITQKPIGLMEDIIAICPRGETVFDPFMGAGTTGVAALKNGRKFIGCEVVEQYYLTAVERCKEVLGGA